MTTSADWLIVLEPIRDPKVIERAIRRLQWRQSIRDMQAALYVQERGDDADEPVVVVHREASGDASNSGGVGYLAAGSNPSNRLP